MITGPARAPRQGATPRQLVVLLHGYGADGEDLIGLADPLGATLPEALFLPVELDRGAELPVPAAITGPETRGPSQIELQMANGRCLRFDAALEAATLMNVIRAVEGA